MEDPNIAIKLKNVSKTFYIYEDRKFTLRSLVSSFFRQGKTRKYKVLSDVNLEVKKGEFIGIIGRNGSGKSTLLKIISGIYGPDKGAKIKINGKIIPFLELGVGFNPELSGRENIYLNGTILGMSRKYITEKFNEIVDFAELYKFIDMPLKNYSSGMMVRLAFAIAIQTDGDIYILDEILSVGDALFQKKSLNIISSLKAKGKTILYVSHSLSSIEKYANRAILINNSKVVFDGSPHIAIKKYEELNTKYNREINEDRQELKQITESITTKSYEIKDVKLFNLDNQEKYVFNSGETFKIRVFVKENIKEKVLNCNIGIHSLDDNTMLSAISSSRDEFKFELDKRLEIELLINSLFLNTGEYFVSLFIFGNTPQNIYDIIYISKKFTVVNTLNKDNGRVVLQHEWRQLN